MKSWNVDCRDDLFMWVNRFKENRKTRTYTEEERIPFDLELMNKITNYIVSGNLPLYNFLKNKWYFDELYDYLFVNPSKKIGLYFWKKIDLRFIDRFGPDGISALIKSISLLAVKFQNGFIYHYAFVMLLGFSALLTFLILK